MDTLRFLVSRLPEKQKTLFAVMIFTSLFNAVFAALIPVIQKRVIDSVARQSLSAPYMLLAAVVFLSARAYSQAFLQFR